MKSTKVTRPGSGRTKGSFSFVKLPLSALTAKFADPATEITVGRKFAEAMGFKDLTSAPASQIAGSIEGKTDATKVGATVTEL